MDPTPSITPETVKSVAYYAGLTVTATVALTNFGKLALEWLKQRHTMSSARITQTHTITTEYLNRALDPSVPLAIRYQLLRFLATPDKNEGRLNKWAEGELARAEFEVVEMADKAYLAAEKALLAAKTASEVEAAEKAFATANQKRRSLLEDPKPPPRTAAAFRAGLIKDENLPGIELVNADLRGTHLTYRNLKSADFSGSDFSEGSLQGSDLRGAKLNGSNFTGVTFFLADLRGAELRDAILIRTRFLQARLEAADLTGAKISPEMQLQATYDDDTKWPTGFDPDKAGAVYVGRESAQNGLEILPPA